MDNASQYRAEIITEFLEGNPDVERIWLPTTTLEVGAAGKYWHPVKRNVLMSEYYAAMVHIRRAMSEYFRTTRPGPDMVKSVCRKLLDRKNF